MTQTTVWNTEEMLAIVYDLNTTKPAALTSEKLAYFAERLKPYRNAKRVKNCIRVQQYGILELMDAVNVVEQPKKVAKTVGKKVKAETKPVIEAKPETKREYVPFNGHSAGCGILYLLNQAGNVTEAKAITLVNRALKYLASEFEMELDGAVKLNKGNVKDIATKLVVEVADLVKDSKAGCTKCEPKPARESKMTCPKCGGKRTEGNGFDRKGSKRIYCKKCNKTSTLK